MGSDHPLMREVTALNSLMSKEEVSVARTTWGWVQFPKLLKRLRFFKSRFSLTASST